MFRKLREHEDRHVEIVVEEANKFAEDLIGQTTTQALKALHTAIPQPEGPPEKARRRNGPRGQARCVKYGDVILDLAGT